MIATAPSSARGVPQVGEILDGKCRIDGILGKGGMGMVLAATHLHLQRKVAVKMVLPEFLGERELVARFLQEGRAASRIQGEHVCQVYDVAALPNGAPYMIMEYLEGRDLGALIEERGSVPISEAVDYLLEACEAIAAAHAQNIVHRDLKPANLFLARKLDGSSIVKVLDFGISKLLHDPNAGDAPPEADMNITKSRTILGSPLYMSPEQLRAAKHVDQRADIWALGVILYELVTGRPPFNASTIAELGAMVLAGAVPPLGIPAPQGFEALIRRCLEREREQRIGTVRAFAEALSEFGTEKSAASYSRIRSAPEFPAMRDLESAKTWEGPGLVDSQPIPSSAIRVASAHTFDRTGSRTSAGTGSRAVIIAVVVVVTALLASAMGVAALRWRPRRAPPVEPIAIATAPVASIEPPKEAEPPAPAVAPPAPVASTAKKKGRAAASASATSTAPMPVPPAPAPTKPKDDRFD